MVNHRATKSDSVSHQYIILNNHASNKVPILIQPCISFPKKKPLQLSPFQIIRHFNFVLNQISIYSSRMFIENT